MSEAPEPVIQRMGTSEKVTLVIDAKALLRDRVLRVRNSMYDAQLDALEVCGYLDPDRRGDRADECDAIEMFPADSLNKR